MSPITSKTVSRRVKSQSNEMQEKDIEWSLYPPKEYARKGRLCYDTHFVSISGISQDFENKPNYNFSHLKSITLQEILCNQSNDIFRHRVLFGSVANGIKMNGDGAVIPFQNKQLLISDINNDLIILHCQCLFSEKLIFPFDSFPSQRLIAILHPHVIRSMLPSGIHIISLTSSNPNYIKIYPCRKNMEFPSKYFRHDSLILNILIFIYLY